MSGFGGLSLAVWRALGFGGLTNSESGYQYAGPGSSANDSGAALTDDRAMQIAAVWSCVRLISETVGSLPLHVYRKTNDGREVEESHPVAELLRFKPNPYMTPLEFREALTAQVALWGNGYAAINREGGRVVSVVPLRPDRMAPKRLADGLVYEYCTDSGKTIMAPESVLHIKGFGTDGFIGLSPLKYAAQVLGLTISADKYAGKSFSSGGMPSGVLTIDKFLTDEQRKQLRTLYESVSEQNGLWVLEGGTNYQQLTMPPDVLQMLDSRRFQLGEIARIFRVPSFLINDTEKSTSWGSGIEQQNLGFLAYTLRPYLTRWESAVNNALFTRTERRSYFVEHSVEGLLRADSAARAQFYATMAQNGIFSRNEIRRKENMPPVDGGDDLTVQVNLTPVSELTRVNDGNQTQPDRDM